MTEPTNTSQPPYPAPKPQGLAVASLVLGFIGCLPFFSMLLIPSILSICFGGIAMLRVHARTGGGRGFALAGIICGVVGVVFFLSGVAWFLLNTLYKVLWLFNLVPSLD